MCSEGVQAAMETLSKVKKKRTRQQFHGAKTIGCTEQKSLLTQYLAESVLQCSWSIELDAGPIRPLDPARGQHVKS